MKILRFEDIEAWKEARKLVKNVYGSIEANKKFQKDFRLANQIQGAAAPVMSNIAEGSIRKINKEFIQFLFISKGSAAEVQSQLYFARDQKYISKIDFDRIYDQAEKVAKMTSGFIKYLRA